MEIKPVEIIKVEELGNMRNIFMRQSGVVVVAYVEAQEDKADMYQAAYEQVHSDLQFELTQEKPSMVDGETEAIENFQPDERTPSKLVLGTVPSVYFNTESDADSVSKVELRVLDQYGEDMDTEGVKVSDNISTGKLVIPKVTENTEVKITAELGDLKVEKTVEVNFINDEEVKDQPSGGMPPEAMEVTLDHLLELDFRIARVESLL